MKDFSSFEKKFEPLLLSSGALSSLKEVARQTRHYKKSANTVVFGKDGCFDKVLDISSAEQLRNNYAKIADYAQSFVAESNCAFLAHGHLKGVIIDDNDVYFDHRLLSSGDIANLVEAQKVLGDAVKLYMACISCDDLGKVTMQILSYDGKSCYQHTNVQVNGSKMPNDPFDELVILDSVNAKF